jgi:MFS family permease
VIQSRGDHAEAGRKRLDGRGYRREKSSPVRGIALDLTPLRTSRDFRLFFTAAGVSGFGSFITYVTIPFQVAAITESPLAVGLLGLCELVPLLVMAFVGGALADYLDRRVLVLVGEIAFTALCGVLLINAMAENPQIWLLYAVAALTAAVDGIQRPALEGLTPRLVTPDEIPAASALNSLRMQIASLGGPALAGILIASVDLAWVYAIDLGTFAVSLLCLAAIRAVPPPPAAERPSLRSVAAGLRYARSRPELLGTYLVDINAMFFGMPQALYPFLAERLGGPAVLGLLYAAPSAGSLLATVSSGWTARVHRHGLAVTLAAGAWGVAIVGFGLANSLWLALFCLLAAGAADMVSGLFRMTIWNQTIPDRLRGRLAGIEMLSYTTGPLLGNVRSGLAARWLGVGGSVISGGILCVLGTVALAATLPAFLRYDGRDGLARKQAEDEAWAAAHAPVADVGPGRPLANDPAVS